MILLLSLALLSISAHAGDFIADCDTVAASRDTCLSWVQSSARELGCGVSPTTVGKACLIHPWGSDFIKSWVCTVSSPDCDPFINDQKNCPEGFEHLFKGGWDVCRKKSSENKFKGLCRHTMETHTAVMTSCPESISVCGKLGGYREKLSVLCQKGSFREPIEIAGEPYACEDIAKKCTAGGGQLIQEWKVDCGFRDTRISRVDKSCEALQSRCERGNSPQGARGILESCALSKTQ